MARTLDIAWLRSICANEECRVWIDKLINWRDYTLQTNRFVDDPSSFILRLGKHSLRFNASSSYSTIEVYHEIFKENAHFLAPGFNGSFGVVIDVGANQGFYTLKVKEISPQARVVAVEPNPGEYDILAENLLLNGIGGVKLENVAIGAADGMLKMEVIPQIGAIGGQMLRIPERPWIKDEFVKTLEVPALALDSLFEKHGIIEVDVLKVDVEGLELDIFTSCRRLSCVKRIVTEYHSADIKVELIRYLAAKEFDLVLEDPSPSNSYSGDLYFRQKHC